MYSHVCDKILYNRYNKHPMSIKYVHGTFNFCTKLTYCMSLILYSTASVPKVQVLRYLYMTCRHLHHTSTFSNTHSWNWNFDQLNSISSRVSSFTKPAALRRCNTFLYSSESSSVVRSPCPWCSWFHRTFFKAYFFPIGTITVLLSIRIGFVFCTFIKCILARKVAASGGSFVQGWAYHGNATFHWCIGLQPSLQSSCRGCWHACEQKKQEMNHHSKTTRWGEGEKPVLVDQGKVVSVGNWKKECDGRRSERTM